MQHRTTTRVEGERLVRVLPAVRVLALTVATAMVLSTAGCSTGADSGGSSPSPVGDPRPYRVLVIGAISDNSVLADNAMTSVEAAKASAEVINADGGILGHPVEITVADHRADPTVATDLVRGAIASGRRPDVILNSGLSAIAEATLPIISQAGVLSFNVGPTTTSGDPALFPLNFDLSGAVTDQLAATIAYLQQNEYSKVAVLHSSTPYGTIYGDSARKLLVDAGIDVVGTERFEVDDPNVTSKLEALQAKSPDLLLLDAYGAPLAEILGDAQALGWSVPILGNTSVAATTSVATPPPAGLLGTSQAENLVIQLHRSSVYDRDDELVNEAVRAMLKIGPIKANLALASNYDAIRLIRAAAVDVGSIEDPARLARALESPAVDEKAMTAIRSEYIYSDKSHRPRTRPSDYVVIKPAPVRDGQYRPR